jgi:hypothetical protein
MLACRFADARANTMLSWLITSAGVSLEVLLLLRGLRVSVVRKYYFFYSYIFCSILATGSGVLILLVMPHLYRQWYWSIQLGTLVLGYGILLEILNHVLAPYPGAERFARTSGLVALGAIFGFALIAPVIMPHWSPGTVIEFERDLRSVQAIFICGLLAVIFYYGIPIGRNMKGIILGYGLYIVTSLMALAVRSYAGMSFNAIWRIAQPLSLDVSLVIWLVALWSYCPNPVPDPTIHLEEDYEALVSRTRSVIGAIRTYLGKAARA